MDKFLTFQKIFVTVLLCLFVSGLYLTAANALAAEDSDRLLENVGELLQKATAAAMQAKETSDITLSKAALEQANAAAGLLLGLADTAQKEGNAELALVALEMAKQTSSVISDILAISRETANADLASAALDVAEQKSLLISTIAAMAQETDNPQLAQAALSAANNSRVLITQVAETARLVAQTSTDRASVETAEQVAAKSETVQDLNAQSTSTALAAGAIPEEGEGYEAPIPAAPAPQDPPLQDTEAGSAV